MKLKFWQKTYCAILALFLLCLYSVVFVTYRVAYQKSYNAYVEEHLSSQHYMLQNMAQVAQLFFFATGVVSVLFSMVLYIVLSKLYRPLETVTNTANTLANGELSARAVVMRNDEFGALAQSMN